MPLDPIRVADTQAGLTKAQRAIYGAALRGGVRIGRWRSLR